MAAKAGVEERRIQLEQGSAELMAAVIRAVLDATELALSEGQRQTGLRIAAAQLRSLAAGDERRSSSRAHRRDEADYAARVPSVGGGPNVSR